MADKLKLNYELWLLKANGAGNTRIQDGQPVWPTNDQDAQRLNFSPGESHTLQAANLAVIDIARPLAVQCVLKNGDGSTSTWTADMAGLLVLPGATTITISNPSRFGYTLDVPVTATLG